ncbi:MAG: isoprenylcysteine carboxylmethyltransferase family protein [Chloroflexota bacterium]
MNLLPVDSVIRWLGGLLAFVALGIVLYGIWRGTRREVGRTVGLRGGWLRSPWFYLASSAAFLGLAWFGWTPLPLTVSPTVRAWMLALGAILYFPGMCFLLWARLTLGKNYFVSTGFGAQLFKGHQLITSGPYAIVRHPMYAGLILAALGSLALYFTWTTLYLACFAPLLTFRARREETALSQEFGERWREYCRRVPAFIPKW